jgi:Arc/MetJ-type ribon-helix-helix transcriptional regulator
MSTQQSTFSVSDWLAGRLPSDWFTSVEVTIDREEILIVGTIAAPEAGASDSRSGRISRFREDTRAARIEIARELQERTERKVSWGVACGDTTEVFTRLSVPVMTRLNQPQRRVLDTLVEAGVARSRSDALSWCVRLVAQHEADWLGELEQAMGAVREARDKGPRA